MTVVLVANRGEIARRVFRTVRRMDMRCVAVFSHADADAAHVREADEARPIGPAPAADSYLRADRIVQAALDTGARFVHPGYGFLSEDASLAESCEAAGLVFVGPPAAVLRAAGDKREARRTAAAAGVPVLDGFDGDAGDDEALAAAAGAIGFPVLVKPAAGGGGKGMAVVASADELPAVIASARRLAAASFGNDRLLLERYVPDARHIEVQLLADEHGRVLDVFERDCTVQRRHQKVVEEAPAATIDPAIVASVREAAVALGRALSYRNAGTAEFVVGSDGSIGFLEVNARLQVEHPVTEAITGLDLVEWQLRIARGEGLPADLVPSQPRGHAIEVRVYAEDPAAGHLPQAGRLDHLAWPRGARVDAGVEEGDEVTTFYDPLLGKLIVHGPDRPSAIDAMRAALSGAEVLGLATNLPLLSSVIDSADFQAGRITTRWLDSMPVPGGDSGPAEGAGELPGPVLALAAVVAAANAATSAPSPVTRAAAAAATASAAAAPGRLDPWASIGPWRVTGRAPVPVVVRAGGSEELVEVSGDGPWTIREATVVRAQSCHGYAVEGRTASAVHTGEAVEVWWDGRRFVVPVGPRPRHTGESGSARLEAPMPGTVVAVRVAAGTQVVRGAELVVVEAMKMEHPVLAPADGQVRAVLCAAGDRVDRGQVLVDFVPSAAS